MRTKKKMQKKEQQNRARINSCELHSFNCCEALKREKAKQEKWGVSIPILPITVRCRCKNCGGTMSLLYAAPYMDALNHIEKQNRRQKSENIRIEQKNI